jgi:hypothetical protein
MKTFTRLFLPLFTAFCVMLPQSAYAAGAFSLVRGAPVVTSGVAGSNAIIQVAQPYSVTQASTNLALTAANQFSIGAGSGSPASAIAQAALGIGSMSVGLITSPAFGLAMTALVIGGVGYTLYQSLKSNGIAVNPDGSVNYIGTNYTWNSKTYATLYDVAAAASAVYSCTNVNRVLGPVSNGYASLSIYAYGSVATNLCSVISVGVVSLAPRAATKDDLVSAIDLATTNPQSAADAVSYAQSHNINPLAYLPTTQPNLNTAPQSVTLPDGTVVTITPKTTLGSSETVSPAPTSTINATPSPTTTTQAPPVTFPTDYARQGEAAAAAAPVTNAVNGVKDAVTVTASPDLPDTTDSDIQKLGTPPTIPTFDDAGLNGVIPLPFSPDTCAPTTYSYRGVPYTIDLCPYHAQWHGYINFMFGFMGAIMTLRVLFAKEDA